MDLFGAPGGGRKGLRDHFGSLYVELVVRGVAGRGGAGQGRHHVFIAVANEIERLLSGCTCMGWQPGSLAWPTHHPREAGLHLQFARA